VIDIFTSEDMENISLCIFQYLTLYYIIKCFIFLLTQVVVTFLSNYILLGLLVVTFFEICFRIFNRKVLCLKFGNSIIHHSLVYVVGHLVCVIGTRGLHESYHPGRWRKARFDDKFHVHVANIRLSDWTFWIWSIILSKITRILTVLGSHSVLRMVKFRDCPRKY
jgi:hypothetical protein